VLVFFAVLDGGNLLKSADNVRVIAMFLCLTDFKGKLMMKRILMSALVLLFAGVSFGVIGEVDLDSEIWFEVTDLGGGRWQYTYDVSNINIGAGIAEFTIYFAPGIYDNLAVETGGILAATWDEIVWDPVAGVGVDGAYDALAGLSPIAPAMTASGFSVSFDWLGEGTPGQQWYEIIDPDTSATIDSGQTVPEPAMLLLLGLGAIISRRKRS
jgi:hypothetical protein